MFLKVPLKSDAKDTRGTVVEGFSNERAMLRMSDLAISNGYQSTPTTERKNNDLRPRRFSSNTGFGAKRHENRDDGLQDTGGPCTGIVADFKRKYPFYLSDWKDGLVFKSISVTLFLFLACIAPAIAFGGLMGDETEVQVDIDGELHHVPSIGVLEMVIATGVCGTVYAVFCGVPLVILGGTGPLLIFTSVLFDLCKTLDLDFLPVYAMTGLWAALMLFLCAIFNVSKYMSYCTRFTDDIFAGLISTIFIYEAILQMAHALDEADHGLGWTHEQVRFLAAIWLILMLGTCYLTFAFKDLRDSTYFTKTIRMTVSNFGPVLSMTIMTLVAIIFADGLDDEEHYIALPSNGLFQPSLPRSWIVDLSGGNALTYVATIIPAVLVTILIFLDQNITSRILNNPDFKLVKGPAYHWDIMLLSFLVGFQSIMGMPWLVAATVRALTHLQSNAIYTESNKTSLEGPRIIKVTDTRITGFFIHLLILFSAFLVSVLSYIPKAVLGGVFLYMGIASLTGNQFIDRFKLMIMDPAVLKEDSESALATIPKSKIWIYTGVQIVSLAVLWVVKQTQIAISFPLFILLLIPVRNYVVPHLGITEDHLRILDSDEETPVEGKDFSVVSKIDNLNVRHRPDIALKIRSMSANV